MGAHIMKSMVLPDIKGDLQGGITAGIIALPLAIAFGVSSGLGAAAGIYGAIIVGLLAAIFGGTPTQISGPTGPITVVVASIAAMHTNSPHLIFAAIFLSGIFQIIFGLIKLGKFVNFIPYPVISGFMNGIGVTIILLQITAFLGIDFAGTPIENAVVAVKSIHTADIPTAILGLLTLIIVFFTPKKLANIIPAPLIAIILGTAAALYFNFNVNTIGEIPRHFPSLVFPAVKLSEIETIIPISLTIAVLGSIDSLLTSLVADSMTRTKHNSNKELIGQGIGNMTAALFGGLASCGATMRTAVNIKNGGHTRLSGVIHSIFLILVIVFFAPFAAKIPLAVLAGILIKVGISIIDYKFIKLIKIAPRNDLLVMFMVFAITVFDDLILAVGIGIVLSSILFAANIAKQTDIKLTGLKPSNCQNYMDEDINNKTLIMHIDGTLFFGSASQIVTRIDDVLDNKTVIIDCSNIKSIDISAVFALEDLILTLKSRHVKVIIIFNNRNIAALTLKLGLKKHIKYKDIVFSSEEALNKANNCI